MTVTEKEQLNHTFTQAHSEFQKGLNIHAYYKVSNHALAEDLVQQTFLKTWSYLVKGGKVELMRAFLYHILNNLIIDSYRKHKSSSLDALLEKGYEPKAQDGTLRMCNKMDGLKVVILIENLPKIYKKVIHMRYVEDLSLEEMSSLTGTSRNSLAVQIHRGLQKLKVLYVPA